MEKVKEAVGGLEAAKMAIKFLDQVQPRAADAHFSEHGQRPASANAAAHAQPTPHATPEVLACDFAGNIY
eukprot:SAG11_NODE_24930_length_366_cov_0.460674_1_plen_69_part_01